MIRQVSQRLRALLRHGDHVARLGGDEFAILQSGVTGPDDVRTLAQRVVETLAAPYEFQGHPIVCGGSAGAAIYGIDSKTVDDLLHKADLALYRAKAEGRGGFSFYEAQLDRHLHERRELAHDLSQAIESNALTCTTSRCTRPMASRSTATKRWRAGRTPRAATCRRPTSSRWPKKPA